jgi:hypothetical protein
MVQARVHDHGHVSGRGHLVLAQVQDDLLEGQAEFLGGDLGQPGPRPGPDVLGAGDDFSGAVAVQRAGS